MGGCPQKLGICIRVGIVAPKKPNSAKRKIAKINLATGYNVRAVITGAGHALQEHNTVLIRAGRARDIPGVHYKVIRNYRRADLGPPTGFERHRRRSKFGVAQWAYLFRTPGGDPLKVVCSLRSRRHFLQGEWGLPTTWESGRYSVRVESRVEGTLPEPDLKAPPRKKKDWGFLRGPLG